MTTPPPDKTWAAVLRETRQQFQNAGRSIHSGFTWDNVFATVRTLAWLVPLTILIWVYAEREQSTFIPNVGIPIQVSAGGDVNLFAELVVPGDAVITAQLNGPRGQLEAIRQRVMPNKERDAVVVINVDRNHPTTGGLQTLDTAQVLSQHPIFANSGVTLTNCNPAQLKVYVDDYKEEEIEVQRPSDVTNLVGTPSFDPRKVTIRAPLRNINNAKAAGPISVEADLKGLLGKPGPQVSNGVPLIVRPPIENLTFIPSTVRASFEVRAADVKLLYRSMGVSSKKPVVMDEKYIVKCNTTLTNVELLGPPDQIELLRQESLKPTAYIMVALNDQPNKPYIAKAGANLTFEFPPGAQDVRVNPEKLSEYSIEWTLVERTPADQ